MAAENIAKIIAAGYRVASAIRSKASKEEYLLMGFMVQ
jgi:hypothetical protein